VKVKNSKLIVSLCFIGGSACIGMAIAQSINKAGQITPVSPSNKTGSVQAAQQPVPQSNLSPTAPITPALPKAPSTSNSSPTPMAAMAASVGCLIEPQFTAEVGTPASGLIEMVSADRGQSVRKGQLLAVIASDVEKATVVAARTKAESEGEINASMASRDLAKTKLKRMHLLMQQGFASQLEIDQAKSEYEVADQRTAQARESQAIAKRELAVAEEQLKQRTLRSPIDGVVVERMVHPGERVDGKPLFKIAALHPLKVEIIVQSSQFGILREGMAIGVKPDLPNSQELTAQVAQVDKIIDSASGTFRARLNLPNPNREIPAGVRCKANFDRVAGFSGGGVVPSSAPSTVAPSAAARKPVVQ
jgi:membrane fusion protein, heavy metal efflux system